VVALLGRRLAWGTNRAAGGWSGRGRATADHAAELKPAASHSSARRDARAARRQLGADRSWSHRSPVRCDNADYGRRRWPTRAEAHRRNATLGKSLRYLMPQAAPSPTGAEPSLVEPREPSRIGNHGVGGSTQETLIEGARGAQGQTDRALCIEELGRRFRERDVIESLSLELRMGERVALRGPNGAGKTTVLRCVAGTVTPTRGYVSVAGFPAGGIEARRLIGACLSQERSFYLRLTGHVNLLTFARMRCDSEAQAVAQVQSLEHELEIAEFASKRAETYSSGMLHQLAFARALLGAPILLLLDEPTRSLDEGAAERLWQALDRRRHIAVLLTTHNRDDLAHCDSHVDLPT
jgi:ABC-type Na+ transport system ATPase subunit NatA